MQLLDLVHYQEIKSFPSFLWETMEKFEDNRSYNNHVIRSDGYQWYWWTCSIFNWNEIKNQWIEFVENEAEMIETYYFLVTKESSSDRIMINDLNRTFPVHEYFKEQGGVGQESLFKLSRVNFHRHFSFSLHWNLLHRLMPYVMKMSDIVKVFHLLLRHY